MIRSNIEHMWKGIKVSVHMLSDMTSLEKLNVAEIAKRQHPSFKLWDFFLPWQKFPSQFLTRKNPNPMALACWYFFDLNNLALRNKKIFKDKMPNIFSCLWDTDKISLGHMHNSVDDLIILHDHGIKGKPPEGPIIIPVRWNPPPQGWLVDSKY